VGIPLFLLAAAISLTASWVLATRLERLGTRFGLADALLGVIAALAADAPEITSAITALSGHQGTVGAGVVLGSNVFNLAALLGVSALVAGRIMLHRRVVLLSGAVAAWVALVTLLAVVGLLPAWGGLALVTAVLVPYLLVLGLHPQRFGKLPLPRTWRRWLALAVREEERELAEPHPAAVPVARDVRTAALALVLVVGASVVMEQAATSLGRRYVVPDLVIGALVLAGVTSLPNAVAAGYLAARGRGAAVLSTALNSNALNVAVGWLLPATVVGAVVQAAHGPVMGLFYAGLTLLALALAYYGRGLGRWAAVVIVGTYLAFVGTVLAVAGVAMPWPAVGPAAVMAATCLWAGVASALDRRCAAS
jgi:cation:H+ antiporter